MSTSALSSTDVEEMARVQPIWVIAGSVAALFWAQLKRNHGHQVCSGVDLLPHLLALVQALIENLDTLQLEVKEVAEVGDVDGSATSEQNWREFVEELVTRLAAVKKELCTSGGLNCLGRASEELVEMLRVEPGVSSILDSYLPRQGQSWRGFIQSKPRTKDQEDFYESVSSWENSDLQLKKALSDWIQGLTEALNQSSVDVTRGGAVEILTRHKPVKVFFATDRRVTANGEYVGNISTRGNGSLHYGLVEVGIPETHQRGVLEAPSSYANDDADPSKHVVVFTVNTELRGNLSEFLKQVDADVQIHCDRGAGELLVYIHGYNVSHLSAVKQAAQLKEDLQFKGTIILYSWSSKGTLDGYFTDERNVQRTVASLKAFLTSIMDMVDAPPVNILAHSMGNRALIGALHALYNDKGVLPPCRPRCPLSQIIFVAADEKRNLFEELLQTIKRSTEAPAASFSSNSIKSVHLTVYSSTKDWALSISSYVHWKHRLGDINSLFNSTEDLSAVSDIHDVIDVTGTEKGFFQLHHSYHVQSPRVLQDMQLLLAQKLGASERGEYLHSIQGYKGKYNFYAFEREPWTGQFN